MVGWLQKLAALIKKVREAFNFRAKPLTPFRSSPLRKISRIFNLAAVCSNDINQSITTTRPVSVVMSAPASRALRRCVCTAKSNASYLRPTAAFAQQRIVQRWQSTDAAAPANPKIATIVDQISQLTLLETADLVSTLKVRHFWLLAGWEERAVATAEEGIRAFRYAFDCWFRTNWPFYVYGVY